MKFLFPLMVATANIILPTVYGSSETKSVPVNNYDEIISNLIDEVSKKNSSCEKQQIKQLEGIINPSSDAVMSLFQENTEECFLFTSNHLDIEKDDALPLSIILNKNSLSNTMCESGSSSAQSMFTQSFEDDSIIAYFSKTRLAIINYLHSDIASFSAYADKLRFSFDVFERLSADERIKTLEKLRKLASLLDSLKTENAPFRDINAEIKTYLCHLKELNPIPISLQKMVDQLNLKEDGLASIPESEVDKITYLVNNLIKIGSNETEELMKWNNPIIVQNDSETKKRKSVLVSFIITKFNYVFRKEYLLDNPLVKQLISAMCDRNTANSRDEE
ncbi:hypothetical protein NEMIN01_1027 [Nematocida minor]|uniref:uncharacterized protein n=1 Tax=Nematocida minor TaxID=1912983 RepID=UPI0022206709|nr:uncharacterized protein NEMIN01_1027 [Nematocida minor]KAI5190403.1 hypothetical protein NEMIN01_1027 [Nematocida minor]